jgi:hypothetical protein
VKVEVECSCDFSDDEIIREYRTKTEVTCVKGPISVSVHHVSAVDVEKDIKNL